MAQQTINESYIGSGIFYVNGRDVGNCSAASFTIEQETKTQKNFRGGGGNADSVSIVTAVKLSLELTNFNNDNLALALRGKIDVITGAPVVDEPIVAKLGGLTATQLMIDTSVAPVVTDSAGTTTYVAGTDYDITAAGLKVLSGGSITDGQALLIDYTSKDNSVLQALVDSGADVNVVMDGINDATGKPSVVKVYRWKPTPSSGLDLISSDFSNFKIEGEVLADNSISGVGKSKFFARAAA